MEKFGEQFLHKKDSEFHASKPVEIAAERARARGEEVSQKPADKIEVYLERFKNILEPEPLEEKPNFDRKERNINFLKRRLYEKVIIDPENIPQNYWNSQAEIMIREGRGADLEEAGIKKQEYIDKKGGTRINHIFPERFQREQVEALIKDQKATLDNWIDYFTCPDSSSFPVWAKYWAFSSMLKLSIYDKEKHAFWKRDKGTVAPFPDLNREALAYVVDLMVKKIEQNDISATKDSPELKNLLEGSNFGKLYAYAIEKVTPIEERELKNTKGEWIKYLKDSDHMPLVKSIQGHGTGWCTAGETTAKSQLKTGDFYVYYSYDQDRKPTIPRIAMRMEGDHIAEVRGIAPKQNLDSYIGDVVEKKLKGFGREGEVYQKKTADMKRLTEIHQQHRLGKELTKENLRFLYEIDSKIQGFGYQEDPRIKELIKERAFKKDISQIIGCSEEEVSTTEEETLRGGIKFHYGDLNLDGLQSAKGLKLPEIINGGLYLSSLRSAEGLKLPKAINSDLYLSSLQSAEGLKLPEVINGRLNLGGLQSAKGLKLPEIINGDLDLYGLQSAKGLKLPEIINGDLDLFGLQSAEGLKLPEIIKGRLYLDNLQDYELGELKIKYPKLKIIYTNLI